MVRKRSCPAVSHTCVAQAQRATETVRSGHRRLHRHARSFVAYLQLHFLSEQIHALELVVDANGCDELGTADAASPPRKRTTHQDDGLRKVTAGRCAHLNWSSTKRRSKHVLPTAMSPMSKIFRLYSKSLSAAMVPAKPSQRAAAQMPHYYGTGLLFLVPPTTGAWPSD